VGGISKTLAKMRTAPQNVRYADLAAICGHFFGEPRQQGTSHATYKTPWRGDPRVNIQEGDADKAKAYQVRQVLLAIDRLRGKKS
jgi:hypothetical protein